jgi:hypothetical protein
MQEELMLFKIVPWVQVWQEEAKHGQDVLQAPVKREISHSQQVANNERAKQVVPAVQSQHETFKCACFSTWTAVVDVFAKQYITLSRHDIILSRHAG